MAKTNGTAPVSVIKTSNCELTSLTNVSNANLEVPSVLYNMLYSDV